eukprot:CAMPEP_0169081334 /NCGR_PEP_ID=MMETSP1015-20121227/10953_1 /TAXON_ID=342587 /ORGANISM="Karlodinium micrum, Strain CCMP2283" /LENGTH=331 /DNA_ID=CAMNT_0009141111 /DNA_START=426 /DNA_END=1420 /DNA_ORIENTATION=+
MAVGGKFAMQAKYTYDPNQELLALGLSNVAGSFMFAYPTTGSFSRTAVNAMLGATSLVSCALSATLVFIATYCLLPVMKYLPLSALAPIIIQGAIGVISVKDFMVAFKTSYSEFIVMLMTFAVSLALTVKEGLATGFILSILNTLRLLASPNMAVLGQLPDGQFRDLRNFKDAVQLKQAVVVRMDARLGFFNSRKFKEFCLHCMEVRKRHGDEIRYLIIDARPINHIDQTGMEMLESLSESLEEHEQKLILVAVKSPVLLRLTRAGIPEQISKHGGFVCSDMTHALEILNDEDPRGSRAQVEVSQILARAGKSQREMPTNLPNILAKCTGL